MDWKIIHKELRFRTSRSSGAGGQHVNKTETRVEALLEIDASLGLTREEKDLIRTKLASKISEEGYLSAVSQKFRSQGANKELVTESIHHLLIRALTPVKKRVRTKIPKIAKEERLQEKKKVAEKKEWRRKPD